jgi:hypothetical protein
MTDISKLAGDVPGILAASAQHLRKLAGQNVELLERATAAEHELRLMKIARRMEQRGLEPNLSLEEKVASLHDVDPSKLDSIEHAVELTAGGFTLGRISQPEDNGTKVATWHTGELYHSNGAGGDDLEEFVASQQAYG